MKYLVTSALPYANGPIHFGHIAGVYLPADIYVRHLKLSGKDAIHISGSDEHGVAIMQNAQKAKVSYQEYVNQWHQEHKNLFDQYQIQFEFFGQTSADYHKVETIGWFKKLYELGFIERKPEKQLQCQDCHNFLPDRFVEGTCYVCGHTEARGDECPSCGTWIDALKLIDPVCKFCHSKNVSQIDSFQWYLMLSKFHKEFLLWFDSVKGQWRKTVTSFVESLVKENLHDRAITRDLDWGIDVPLSEAKGKKLYVWFDAPIGYVSNTKAYLEKIKSNEDYLKDWWHNKDTKIVNFIGKDNIIFHAIIFPVMSMASGFVNPVSTLPANQYVNLAGKQFSKSKGWYIDAKEAIDKYGADTLRYYLTSLIPESSDSSFTWKGFEAKVNSDLSNNLGNFINRVMKFFKKNWPNGLEVASFQDFFVSEDFKLLESFSKDHSKLLDAIEIRRAQEHLMSLCSKVNLYVSDQAPWSQFKTNPELASKTIATSCVYVLYLGVFFQPFTPQLSQTILAYFGLDSKNELIQKIYNGDLQSIRQYFSQGFKLELEPSALIPRIDSKEIEELEAKLLAKV